MGTEHSCSIFRIVADNLQQWWSQRKAVHPHIRKLMIDLDNAPEVSSRRTQFMKRLTQFADKHNMEIELVYYPPYHSKYNAIERCWGALEKHWNGTLLTTIPIVLNWAQSMTWKGIRPIVRMLHEVFRRALTSSRGLACGVPKRDAGSGFAPCSLVTRYPAHDNQRAKIEARRLPHEWFSV